MNTEIRKVQQVGYSTLVVSLPREWVKQVGLKQGDPVSFTREGDGSLRLFPGISSSRKEPVKCIIDVGKMDGTDLVARIITGTYIIGYDIVQIKTKNELSRELLSEIREATQRLTGISIVEQTLNQVTIQNFVDPTRFPVEGLLRRIYTITLAMYDATVRAVKEGRRDLTLEVIQMESEVDRIYWLVVRQLLLAVRDRNSSRTVGPDSLANIMDNRTVAKVLEKIADHAEIVANELKTMLEDGQNVDEETVEGMASLCTLARGLYDKTMDAFFKGDLKVAEQALHLVEGIRKDGLVLEDKLMQALPHVVGGTAEGKVRIILKRYACLRSIIWNIVQTGKSCSTIAEITVSRFLEQPSEICRFEQTS